MTHARSVLQALAFSALLVLTAQAAAQETAKEACANSFEAAQDRRAEDKLKLARDELDACIAACPPVLAEKCQAWRREVIEALPSVVMRARTTDGRELHDVMVRIDGGAAQPLTRDPIELDPGRHTFSFERAGSRAVSQEVTLATGAKETPVVAEFAIPPPPRPPPARPSEAGGGPPLSTWILGALGIAALGVGAALAIAGHVRRAEALEPPPSGCTPVCSDDVVASIRNLWIAGGVTAGVGAVLTVTAGVLWAADDPRGATLALSWRIE